MTIDLSNIEEMVAAGYVTTRKHPDNDLTIYNYTGKAQHERNWNSITRLCRGLILNAEGRVIARPFEKFFEYTQLEPGQIPNEPFEVYEKLDGSLGILYKYEGKIAIATRGSFDSVGARKGTEWITFDPSMYSRLLERVPDDVTLLFEMIGGHRIVLDYGQQQRLVLLAAIDNATGKDLPLPDIGIERIIRYEGMTTIDEVLRHPFITNTKYEFLKEGFVVRFNSGLRIKVKNPEYQRLHTLMTGTTSRTIWERGRSAKYQESLLENVPPDFSAWVKGQLKTLKQEYAHHWQKYFSLFDDILERRDGESPIRTSADIIPLLKHHPKSRILFRMRDIHEAIWEEIKPEDATFSDIH
ncbi:MAG: T4 RnlA family RNA ligase [Chlorobi bacterium]|nr:T4 RnlA family RNA ligase [Chlorobiota bacterium]